MWHGDDNARLTRSIRCSGWTQQSSRQSYENIAPYTGDAVIGVPLRM